MIVKRCCRCYHLLWSSRLSSAALVKNFVTASISGSLLCKFLESWQACHDVRARAITQTLKRWSLYGMFYESCVAYNATLHILTDWSIKVESVRRQIKSRHCGRIAEYNCHSSSFWSLVYSNISVHSGVGTADPELRYIYTYMLTGCSLLSAICKTSHLLKRGRATITSSQWLCPQTLMVVTSYDMTSTLLVGIVRSDGRCRW